ncbi:MAG TPA: PIN-like domain-containing protein [Thermomicrobiales bacterium]|jgi:hypothetical protein
MRLRQMFPEYYPPDDAAMQGIWSDGIITFDTSALLKFYEYSPPTREQLFTLLSLLKERLWLAHQAAYEYQKNRVRVLHEQLAKDKGLGVPILGAIRELRTKAKVPPIEQPEFDKAIDEVVAAVQRALTRIQMLDDSFEHQDQIEAFFDLLFGDNVGKPPPAEERKKLLEVDAPQRYKEKKPPGYADDDPKTGIAHYGDVVLWKQLLLHARDQGRPVLLVTEDFKEDWWVQANSLPVAPRAELIREMQEEAHVRFHMYGVMDFFDQVQKVFDKPLGSGVLEELATHEESEDAVGMLLITCPNTGRAHTDGVRDGQPHIP